MRLSPCGCCAIVISIIGLALAIAGHIIYAMRVPTGELPLWYTLQTCRQSKDVAIGPRNFDLYPLAPTGSSSECAQPYNPASAATRIMIDESDGVRKGAQYYPSFLLKSDSYATVSFSIEDRTGNVLMSTANMELGPEEEDGYTDYPWRYIHFPPSAPPSGTSPASPPPLPSSPSAPPPPPARRMLAAARRTEAAAMAAEAAAAALAAGLPHPLRRTFGAPLVGELSVRSGWESEIVWAEQEEEEFDLDGWEADFANLDLGEEEEGEERSSLLRDIGGGGLSVFSGQNRKEAAAVSPGHKTEEDFFSPGQSSEEAERAISSVRRRRRSFSSGGSRRRIASTPTTSRRRATTGGGGSTGGGTTSRPTSTTFSRSSATTFSRSSTSIARRRTSASDSRRRTSSGAYSTTSGSYSSSAYYGGRTSTYGTARWGYATPYYYYPFYTYPLLYPYYYSPFGYYYGPWGYYYGYSYPYAYLYGPVAIRSGGVLLVVRQPYYVCTCCGGNGCDQRPAESLELPADQDRYEIDEGATFIAPGNAEAYPLYIVVYNATAWLDVTVESQPVIEGGVNIFINFYTDDGGSLGSYGMVLLVIGYLLLAIGLINILFLACRGMLCLGDSCCPGGGARGGGGASGAQMNGVMQYQSKFT